MNLKPLAPLLLSLFSAFAFAHNNHDDEAPQPPLKQEVVKDAKPAAAKPKHKPAAAKDEGKSETPAAPEQAPAEPKKQP